MWRNVSLKLENWLNVFQVFFWDRQEIDTMNKVKDFKLNEPDEKSCIWIMTLKQKLKSLGTAFFELEYRENGKTNSSFGNCE